MLKKFGIGLFLLCGLCAMPGMVRAQEAPAYFWHQELKANIGKDGRSWTKGYFGTDLIFEGSTSDGYETTFTITNPTRDNPIAIPDGTGTVALKNLINIYFGSSATKTLDTNEAQASVLRGYGTTNACTITTTPPSGHVFLMVNSNTGNGTITIKISGGTGTAVLPGTNKMLYSNGTNTDIANTGL